MKIIKDGAKVSEKSNAKKKAQSKVKAKTKKRTKPKMGETLFCDLHSHSDFSIHDAFAKIDDKIKKAQELGYDALAMTEHGTTTGLMEHYLKCTNVGLKPILGYEGYFSFEPEVKGGKTYHIILLAKDIVGYRNLLKIASYSSYHFYKKPRLGFEILKECSEGIICSTACVAGVLSCEEPLDMINQLKSIFGDNFYLEVQPHNFQEQIDYNKKVIALSEKTGVPMIVTCDSHYVNREDREVHRQWLGLNVNESEALEQLEQSTEYQNADTKQKKAMRDKIEREASYYGSGDYHMWSKSEVIDWFVKVQGISREQIQSWLNNISNIIEQCNVIIPLGEDNSPIYEGNPERYIRDACNVGWVAKGVNKLKNHQQYKEQVLHELNVLNKVGYMNYMCIIHDVIHWCKQQHIPTGVGRGSVGGSLVAYLSDITDVDPIKYNLVFERFANPERVTSADVDFDVASDRRDDVIEYVKDKYGEVFQIRTISYIQDKSAVIKAGKVLGYSASECTSISKNIQRIEEVKDKELRELAEKFVGHIQAYGKHASAVVVFPKEATNWCAIEKQGDDFVAAQDYHLLEKQGIMKLDILGLETLTIIDNTLKLIKAQIGEDIDLATIDYNDTLTGDMLKLGYTEGCFQIESQTMTNIIRSINTTRVEDLIDTVALGRPGVLDAGMDKIFIQRRQKLEPVTYLHSTLKPILQDTEGVILYQEQIMQICQELCGYSLGEADNVRRVIGRKITEEMQPIIDDMLDRGIANGIDRETMQEICNEIVTFASYGFNRGHSAAYGITAWRTAWLKAHYTSYFYASLFDSWVGDKSKLASYINAAKNDGIEVFPPDIQNSHQTCRAINGDILLGFNCITGVGSTVIDTTDFTSPKQWIEKHIKYNKKILSGLILSGCFDKYNDTNRYDLLEYMEWLKDTRKPKAPYQFSGKAGKSYGELELHILGYAFTDIFSEYDLSLVDNIKHFAIIVTNVKAHKTRHGKPMAFVKGMSDNNVRELVVFDKDFSQLEKRKMYIMTLDGTIIKDFVEAKKRA